eukprot:4531677-Amphidinium_carterae.1
MDYKGMKRCIKEAKAKGISAQPEVKEKRLQRDAFYLSEPNKTPIGIRNILNIEKPRTRTDRFQLRVSLVLSVSIEEIIKMRCNPNFRGLALTFVHLCELCPLATTAELSGGHIAVGTMGEMDL